MNTNILAHDFKIEKIFKPTPKGIVEQELFRKIQKVKKLALIHSKDPSLKNAYELRKAENEIILFVLGGV